MKRLRFTQEQIIAILREQGGNPDAAIVVHHPLENAIAHGWPRWKVPISGPRIASDSDN
jgi:hypothetical protein